MDLDQLINEAEELVKILTIIENVLHDDSLPPSVRLIQAATLSKYAQEMMLEKGEMVVPQQKSFEDIIAQVGPLNEATLTVTFDETLGVDFKKINAK